MLYYFKSNYIGYIFVVYLALCTGEKSKNHSQISCDFNNDLCEYNSNGNFIRYNGTSPGDRLQEKGYYVICDKKLMESLDDKCILTQRINLYDEYTISFWYYMPGNQDGYLLFKIENYIVWTKFGPLRDEWLNEKIQLPPGNYEIALEASYTSYSNDSRDISIDDIELEEKTVTTATPLKSTTITSDGRKPTNILLKIFIPIISAIVGFGFILVIVILVKRSRRKINLRSKYNGHFEFQSKEIKNS